MKLSYKGFEIDARREPSLGGEVFVYFSIFRESDGYEVASGYEGGYVRDSVRWMKAQVDRIVAGQETVDGEEIAAGKVIDLMLALKSALRPTTEPET